MLPPLLAGADDDAGCGADEGAAEIKAAAGIGGGVDDVVADGGVIGVGAVAATGGVAGTIAWLPDLLVSGAGVCVGGGADAVT